MGDSLRPAALLVDRLGDRIELILPEVEPVIDGTRLAAARIELRQVAGLSAGGAMELRPGRWDFGPARRGPGRLQGGDPDSVGFTLDVGDDLSVTIEPGDRPVRVGDEPVLGPTEVGGRVIDAGSARFVVARPRPTSHRSGGDVPPEGVAPWAVDPTPCVGPAPRSPRETAELVAQRCRLHLGPDEIRHRIETGSGHGVRRPGHPLFGTAVVGLTDLAVGADPGQPGRSEATAAVPVAVDLLGSATVLTGRRSRQLAVARHLLIALAATTDADDVHIALLSDRPDLAFVGDLPHGAGRPGRAGEGRRTLLVVDRDAWWSGPTPTGGGGRRRHRPEPGTDRWPILADGGALLIIGQRADPIPEGADVVAVVDDSTLSVHARGPDRLVRRAVPIGYGPCLTRELVDRLGG
jgi:hypothetical protein